MKTNNIPETVNKSTALIVLMMLIFAGCIGYAFGADAGYAKGLQDATRLRTLSPEPIQMP